MDEESSSPPLTLKQRFSQWRDVHRLGQKFEYLYPGGVGLVAFALTFFFSVSSPRFERLVKDVAPVAISVAAIFAGFQGAIQAIILSMGNSRVIKKLKNHGHLDRLMKYIRDGTMALVAFVIVAMVVITLWAMDSFASHLGLVAAVLNGVFFWAMASSTRIMAIMLKLIGIASSEEAPGR